MANCRHNLGMLLIQKGKYKEALKELDGSLNISTKNHFYPIVAVSYITKAFIYTKLSDLELANAFADKSMEIGNKVNDQLTIAEVYKIKGIINREKNKFDLSENFFLSSIRINQELGTNLILLKHLLN